MAQSHQMEIEFLQSITQWRDRQLVIDYLQAFDWNLEDAVNAFLNDPRETTPDIHSTHSELGTSSRRMALPSLPDRHDEHEEETPSLAIFQTFHQRDEAPESLFQRINTNIIGNDLIILTPWGPRKAIYADYVASGRGLRFIENFMLEYVWPCYANTHSENNAFALRTTTLRENSRSTIKKCVNATAEDVVIFVGSGSTAAINKLANVLNLGDKEVRRRSVVFISISEHHSNILPWENTGVEVVRIPNNARGLLDEDILKAQLHHYYDGQEKHIICSFTAASNVTGILIDVNRISTLVHSFEGWIFWDYAAGAPYIQIDMNPSAEASKDAVFISPHKFIGGPGTPGLLIAKKKLFTNGVPNNPGGGAVVSVTRTRTEYTGNIEEREEAGTPDILGAIKTGLVFELQRAIGYDTIHAREMELTKKFLERFRDNQTLRLLGPKDVPRLPIFAFLIFVPTLGTYLHHNFVCSLLNDLFGIQVRSGCSCAGPYVLDLLDLPEEVALTYTRFISENPQHRIDQDDLEIPYNLLMKPGFTRLNLAYFADDAEIERILAAVEFIARFGWRFLPLYKYNQETAIWRPRHLPEEEHVTSETNIRMVDYIHGLTDRITELQQTPSTFQSQLPWLQSLSTFGSFVQARIMSTRIPTHVHDHMFQQPDPPLNVPRTYERLIWFATPMKAAIKLLVEYENQNQANDSPVAFRPRYSGS